MDTMDVDVWRIVSTPGKEIEQNINLNILETGNPDFLGTFFLLQLFKNMATAMAWQCMTHDSAIHRAGLQQDIKDIQTILCLDICHRLVANLLTQLCLKLYYLTLLYFDGTRHDATFLV